MSADIVKRLRQTRADMIGTDDEDHYWACHQAADHIESLRREVRTQRQEIAALREERRAILDDDRSPGLRNDNPGGGWIP